MWITISNTTLNCNPKHKIKLESHTSLVQMSIFIDNMKQIWFNMQNNLFVIIANKSFCTDFSNQSESVFILSFYNCNLISATKVWSIICNACVIQNHNKQTNNKWHTQIESKTRLNQFKCQWILFIIHIHCVNSINKQFQCTMSIPSVCPYINLNHVLLSNCNSKKLVATNSLFKLLFKTHFLIQNHHKSFKFNLHNNPHSNSIKQQTFTRPWCVKYLLSNKIKTCIIANNQIKWLIQIPNKRNVFFPIRSKWNKPTTTKLNYFDGWCQGTIGSLHVVNSLDSFN